MLTPLVALCALLLLLALQKQQAFAAFCILLFIITLAAHACSYVFSFIQFLCILLLEEAFVQPQALQQRVPGPSPNQSQLSVGATLLPCPFCSGMEANHTAKFHRGFSIMIFKSQTVFLICSVSPFYHLSVHELVPRSCNKSS